MFSLKTSKLYMYRYIQGGLSTAEEMCLTFVMYYPRVPLEYCCSSPKYEAIHSHPMTAVEQISNWNWDDAATHQKFKSLLDSTLHYHSALFNNRPVGDQVREHLFNLKGGGDMFSFRVKLFFFALRSSGFFFSATSL